MIFGPRQPTIAEIEMANAMRAIADLVRRVDGLLPIFATLLASKGDSSNGNVAQLVTAALGAFRQSPHPPNRDNTPPTVRPV